LNQNVSEEELEFAVQAPAEHERGDPDLKDGMRDPERVIENLKFFAHLSRSPARLPVQIGRPTLAVPNPMFNALR
jgi:hypothetical protein